MDERPKYIIKVHRNWRHRGLRFWKIMEWHSVDGAKDGGYWSPIYSGSSYTKSGMARAIKRGFKKISFGNHTEYFNIDGSTFDGIK